MPVADRRFAGEAWRNDPRFDGLTQTYLGLSDMVRKNLDAAPLEGRSKAQWGFVLRQVVDALSPANCLATNPRRCRPRWTAAARAWSKACACSCRTCPRPRVDDRRQRVRGRRNVATTPGSVVFENDLIQLIQYAPTTAKVHERPLLIVPPCINKYYILDLQPDNSLVATRSGATVFWSRGATPAPRVRASSAGTTTSSRGVMQAIDVACRSPVPTASTRWASASAAR